MRSLLLLLVPLAATLLLPTARAEADPLPLLTVTMLGPKAVRVQLSFGREEPCDSNMPVIDKVLEPGEHASVPIPPDKPCVCARHASESFPRTEFGQSHILCRPNGCQGRGRPNCWISQVPIDVVMRSDVE
jgi:hypothetical protein